MRKHINKSITTFVIATILASPFKSIGQEPTATVQEIVTQACADAKVDAKKDVAMNTWAACGCIPILGVGCAYLFARQPKEEKLIGKSIEYVQAYTETYKSETKAIQTKAAMIGCLGSTLVGCTAFVVYKETDECCSGGFDIWPDCSW